MAAAMGSGNTAGVPQGQSPSQQDGVSRQCFFPPGLLEGRAAVRQPVFHLGTSTDVCTNMITAEYPCHLAPSCSPTLSRRSGPQLSALAARWPRRGACEKHPIWPERSPTAEPCAPSTLICQGHLFFQLDTRRYTEGAEALQLNHKLESFTRERSEGFRRERAAGWLSAASSCRLPSSAGGVGSSIPSCAYVYSVSVRRSG